ncbi:MAG: hypothetical protein ACT4PY_00930 [Armatimonadota bacterium]
MVSLTAAAGLSQPTDPRAAQIRQRLERQGLKVLDVSFVPAKGSSPAVWAAGTSAKYDQPSWDRVTDQALTVWNIMFAILKAEQPQTVLAAPQDWKQYRLFITAPLAKISAFDEGVRTAKTDADTQRVFQALYAGIVFRVFDLKQQKFIDDKEFVKVHFTK